VSRFDHIFQEHDDTEFLLDNGLVEMNDEETREEEICMNSALPLSLVWKNRDDNEKYVRWDDELVRYMKHNQMLIDQGGRESFEPFTIYQSMGLNFLDGFALNQGSLGSCCGAAHRNAHIQTTLVDAKLMGVKPIETSLSITYAVARGNGRIAWGSGLNLQPMAKWAAKIGNYLTSDMGKYDTRGGNVNAANKQRFSPNALKHQSTPCYLPNVSFDTFYEVARAGWCCNIGSSSWASGSVIDANGMSVGNGKSTGAHATCLGGFAIEINGTKYILWTNSHGPRFRQGTRIKQNPFGCFMTKQNWNLLAISTRFGTPYINFSEMGHIEHARF
jgi:hypothetical protein